MLGFPSLITVRSAAIQKGKESGAARGIDFQGVENVVNVDFPPSPAAYVHRVGRYSSNYVTGCRVVLIVSLATYIIGRQEGTKWGHPCH